MKTKNELIKRAQIGGYVKADTTGTNKNWEVGKITKTDDKNIWFKSAVDNTEVKISRSNAFKATQAEYDAAKTVAPADKYDTNIQKMATKTKKLDKADLNTDIDDAADVEQELGEDDEARTERSIVKSKYRTNYVQTYSAAGNSSKHNNDKVAMLFEGKNLDETYDIVARTVGTNSKDLMAQWGHLNIGQQRMLLGNKMRKHMRDMGTL